jgi:hypothetical protein
MRKIVSLRQALDDRQYFGGQLAGESWAPWRSLLLAIMGEELTADELTTFTALTGRLQAPLEPVREFAGVIYRPSRWQEPCARRPGRVHRHVLRSSANPGAGRDWRLAGPGGNKNAGE